MRFIWSILVMCGAIWAGEIKSELFLDYKAPKFGAQTVDESRTIVPKKWADSSLITIISFGATWCVPCQTELPFLDSLQKSNPKIRVLSILTDEKNDDKLKQYVLKKNLSFPVLHDQGGLLGMRFGIGKELPFTVLIDNKGIVRRIQTGFQLSEKQALLDMIENLSH